MNEIIPWALTAATLIVTEWRLRRAAKANESNQKAILHLETGKLDLSAAELGSEIFRGIIAELRAEIKECDDERMAMRAVLIRYGLIPRPGDREGA